MARLKAESQTEHPLVTFGAPTPPEGDARMWDSTEDSENDPPAPLFTAIRLHAEVIKHAQQGVRAIAWDEYSGTLLMVTGKSTRVYNMDFGYARQEDEVDALFHGETDRSMEIIAESSRSTSEE